MALVDYRLCDVCGDKAFYDERLNYERAPRGEDGVLYVGQKIDFPHKCDYLGDWAVLCTDCSKTHKTAIVPKGE